MNTVTDFRPHYDRLAAVPFDQLAAESAAAEQRIVDSLLAEQRAERTVTALRSAQACGYDTGFGEGYTRGAKLGLLIGLLIGALAGAGMVWLVVARFGEQVALRLI